MNTTLWFPSCLKANLNCFAVLFSFSKHALFFFSCSLSSATSREGGSSGQATAQRGQPLLRTRTAVRQSRRGEGALEISELQRAGKSPMFARDFLRGFPLVPGEILG